MYMFIYDMLFWVEIYVVSLYFFSAVENLNVKNSFTISFYFALKFNPKNIKS